MRDVYFLGVVGSSIQEDVAITLFIAARELMRDGKKRHKISGHDFEGVVTTEFHPACIGSISGTMFKTEIEGEGGKLTASFIVHSKDLAPLDPDELRIIYGNSRASNAHLN